MSSEYSESGDAVLKAARGVLSTLTYYGDLEHDETEQIRAVLLQAENRNDVEYNQYLLRKLVSATIATILFRGRRKDDI